jgi:apolipoprotein N-acyltransferase
MAASFDWKKLSSTDRVIAITSLVALIALFLPWEGASGPGYSYSVSGFSTSYGWLGALLVIAAGVYLVMLRSGSTMPRTPYGPGVIVLGLSVIGAVLVIIRWISLPRGSYAAGFFNYGPRIGIFLALIAAVVQAVFALRLFRSTGEALPWAK